MTTIPGYGGFLPPRDAANEIRGRIDELSQELATGRHADLGSAMRSDFSMLSLASHDLRTYEARNTALAQSASWGASLQTALGAMRGMITDVGAAASTASGSGAPNDIRLLSTTAEGLFSDMVDVLGGTANGRALFGNGQPGAAGLSDAGTMIADIRALAATSAGLADFEAAVTTYFGPGGPYEASLSAMPDDAAAFPLGDGRTVEYQIDALSEEIRDALSTTAFVMGLDAAADPNAGSDLPGVIAARVLDAASGLASVEGRIGAVEARISDYQGALAAERVSAERQVVASTAPDPYEVATRLQEAMTRLETTYAITARRAQMRLTDYLR